MASRGAEREEDAVEIHAQDAPPLVGGHVDERHRAADAGVGEAGVDASETLEGGREGALDRGFVADVAG